jgi:hypothetical protein
MKMQVYRNGELIKPGARARSLNLRINQFEMLLDNVLDTSNTKIVLQNEANKQVNLRESGLNFRINNFNAY